MYVTSFICRTSISSAVINVFLWVFNWLLCIVFQSRQMQHELEMERLALKAKEKAIEASQKLQAYHVDAILKEAKQKENIAEEKQKKASELHVRNNHYFFTTVVV